MSTDKKKTCSIALMSGKGGSGKTTLALSMASLLSSCGIKTLLIDCDLSTNGATYFFEDEMSYCSYKIDTLHETIQILGESFDESNISEMKIKTYSVNPRFDFFPSVTTISESWSEYRISPKLIKLISMLFGNMSINYDVVIFDCQAGYTQLLEAIIPISDRNLMVLEAVSISASAIRNLFLKLNQVWGNKKVYQIFSKATKEEEEIYSKVTTGTMFDNIGCIRFDWTVRSAFSVSRVPDMIHTSADYGKQVCNLCDNLIRNPEITRKIDQYVFGRKLDELKNNKMEIEKEYARLKEYVELSSRSKKKKMKEESLLNIISLGAGILALLIALSDFLSLGSLYFNKISKSVIVVVFTIAGSILFMIMNRIYRYYSKRTYSEPDELTVSKVRLEMMKNTLERIDEQIVEHESEIKRYDADSTENDIHQ